MVNRRVQLLVTRAHAWVYRRTHGRLGARLGAMPQVLLTTRGRSSGQPRTTPLTGIPYGTGVLLVASDGGKPEHPHWYRNLQAEPRVLVQRGAQATAMRARTLDADERARLWPVAVATYAGYATYQARTDREIPLVLCEPITG